MSILQSFDLHKLLVILLPIIYAIIGTSGGRILAQDGFSKNVNAGIAWAVVVLCAVATAYQSNQLIGDPYAIVSTIIGIITLLISGALSSLRPYLIYLDWLQSSVFNVIKADPVAATVAPRQFVRPAPRPIALGTPAQTDVQITAVQPVVQHPEKQ